MKIVDLTHTSLREGQPAWPGTEPPKFEVGNELDVHGFRETLITMFSHTGTHMDAPYHYMRYGTPLEQLPIDIFVGKGLVIDATALKDTLDGIIGMEFIEPVKEKADQADFLLFKTGWDAYWATDKMFDRWPCPGDDVCYYMLEKGMKGIGVEVLSIDPLDDDKDCLSPEFQYRHKIVLKDNNFVIIENLCNLDQCGDDLFTFITLPLKYEQADGAPCRAIAILDD